MEGKLIKQEKEYYALYNTEGIFISDVNGGSLANRLSLKNCEVVKNGYDLDELAENYALEVYDKVEPDENYQDYANFNNRKNNFEEGFQKALELFGDKKFSEEDMREAYGRGFLQQGVKSFNSLIQSLQQTEWDVEIVTKPFVTVGLIIADFSEDTPVDILNVRSEVAEEGYALDADGCLILRRK